MLGKNCLLWCVDKREGREWMCGERLRVRDRASAVARTESTLCGIQTKGLYTRAVCGEIVVRVCTSRVKTSDKCVCEGEHERPLSGKYEMSKNI